LTEARGEFGPAARPLFAAFVGMACGVSGLPLYTLGLFIAPLSAAFGWSRTALGAWATCYTLSILLASPLAGRLVDRFGAARVAAISFALLALTWFAASANPGSLLYFYATAIGVALLGCGTLPGTFSKGVASWFEQSRGLALGLAACGAVAGPTILGQFLPRVIASHGWRSAYQVLATVPLIAIPIILLWLRERPASPAAAIAAQSGIDRRDAIRMPVFWLLGLCFLCFCAMAVGAVVHLVPALGERGIPASRYGLYIGVMSASGAIGRVAMGWLLDRVFAPVLLIVIFALSGLACLLLIGGGGPWLLVAVALIGLAIGTEIDLIAYLTAAYFGLRHYSSLYGYLYGMHAIGAAIGPLALGWAFDRTGSYAMPYALAAGAAFLSALIIMPVARFPYLRA
jgi:MFS family permease